MTRVTIIIIIAKTSSLSVDNIRPGPVCNARVFANSSILMAFDQNIIPAGFEGKTLTRVSATYFMYIRVRDIVNREPSLNNLYTFCAVITKRAFRSGPIDFLILCAHVYVPSMTGGSTFAGTRKIQKRNRPKRVMFRGHTVCF